MTEKFQMKIKSDVQNYTFIHHSQKSLKVRHIYDTSCIMHKEKSSIGHIVTQNTARTSHEAVMKTSTGYFLYISRFLSQLTYGWDQSRASRKLPKGRQSWKKSSERQTREVWHTDSHVCTISNMQSALCQWDSSHRPDFHKRHVFCHNSGRVGYKHFTWTQTAVLVFRHRLCASQKWSDVFNATRLTWNSLQLFCLYKQIITNAVHYSLLFL